MPQQESSVLDRVTVDRSQSRHYAAGDRRYFSVSSILHLLHGREHVGAVEDMARGTALHRLFASMLTTGVIEYDSEYIAWQKRVFDLATRMRAHGLLELERTLVSPSPLHPFAGTVDVIWHVDGDEILDLKTGAPEPWHRVQVQAYGWLYRHVTGAWPKRLGLLYAPWNGDGPPRYVSVTRSPRDWSGFCNALSLLIYRETL
jgi:hypothetical protein